MLTIARSKLGIRRVTKSGKLLLVAHINETVIVIVTQNIYKSDLKLNVALNCDTSF
jgi:hypothetical protein